MNGRESILKTISANKPSFIPAPEIIIDRPAAAGINLVQQFAKMLENVGGKLIVVDGYQAVKDSIEKAIADGGWIVNMIPEAGGINNEIDASFDALSLETVYKAYIKGTLAVAENGAIWIKESQAVNRLLPFICQHLVLVVATTAIVPTLHEAYQQINVAEEGYGVFIAGPSKTADIEQSLVIGAHGARSLDVYLVN